VRCCSGRRSRSLHHSCRRYRRCHRRSAEAAHRHTRLVRRCPQSCRHCCRRKVRCCSGRRSRWLHHSCRRCRRCHRRSLEAARRHTRLVRRCPRSCRHCRRRKVRCCSGRRSRLWVLKTSLSAKSLRPGRTQETVLGRAEPNPFIGPRRPSLLQNEAPTCRRDPRSAAATWRAQTLGQATTAQQRRLWSLGAAVAVVEQLE
jgi:hypothetical protein